MKFITLCCALVLPLSGMASGQSSTNPGSEARPGGPPLHRGGAQTWVFDVETSGQDVNWTSPTSVDPSAVLFNTSYLLTLVEVDVLWNGLTFSNIDVTDQVPPELRAGTSPVPGPAPITVLDQTVVFPSPPEPPAVSAQLSFGLDATGFGFVDATNVVLGQFDIDLGIFGIQTVDILSVRIVGNLTIHPTWFDLGQALAGTTGDPVLAGLGTLNVGEPVTLSLSNALPGSFANLFAGISLLNAPYKGGILVPAPIILVLGLPVNGAGTLTLTDNFPAGAPSGLSLYMQFWIVDAGGPRGLSASNAIQGDVP